MGMSDEMKVSHGPWLTMIAQQFGDADHHLERSVVRHEPSGPVRKPAAGR
jgi:hypothetical protein